MRWLLLFLSFLCVCQCLAQYPICTHTYFKNGKISTSQCYDTDKRWGKAIAYNKTGQVIYEKELRRIAGHSSVSFSFYDNGAVKEAQWSSAPDAGIQWYRCRTRFSEEGSVTGEDKDSWDDGPGRHTDPSLRPTAPTRTKPSIPPQKPAETTECAEIYVSEFWLINTTPYTVTVVARKKAGKPETHTITLRPRQKVKGGGMPGAAMFDDPGKYYSFSASAAKASKKREFLVRGATPRTDTPAHHTCRYYFEIRRII